jgi:Domain of unknown function (DUF4214)/G8 domain
MKRSRSSFRALAKAQSLAIIVIVIGAFPAATALMVNRSNQQERDNKSSSPTSKTDMKLEKDLFVDKDSKQNKNLEMGQVQDQDGEVHSYPIEKAVPAIFSGDVRNLPRVPAKDLSERPEFESPFDAKQLLPEAKIPHPEEPNVALAPMPNPIQNFPGLGRLDLATNGSGQIGAGTPPDTNGDVGPNHYIQAVNSGFGIFSKTGTLLASFTENSLFAAGPTGTICDTNSGGDPIVLYDSLADRWILSNFAFTGNATVGPFFQCIAASRSDDPVSGGWNLYAIRADTGLSGQPPLNTFPDYPKFGVWTDCLYYAANGFNSAGSYNGGLFGSFSRVDMYSGAALTGSLGFSASTSDFFTMMPSHLSAPANGLPPAGRLNFFVQESLTAFNFRVRTFTPGTNCGGTGTLSAVTTVSQTSYTNGGTDVTQPNTTNLLDSLSDRIMQKNQYRNVGGTESLWITHTTRTAPVDQPQWAQINVTGGAIAAAPVQQQIYAPDATLNRWMPSIAADKDGNVALAYSTSNGTSPNFPSIAYSGRLAGDALNQLPQTETQLIAGSGSQTGNCGGAPCHRWGDYSSISVDPSDSCTFWVTNEYFVSQADGTNSPPIWATRIGSFSFAQPAQCSPVASTPTVPATPTVLSFTSVTQFAMTLNWTDNATNEDGYVIYRSTDNVNFSFAAITAANATSQAFSGLTPGTTYFWKVYAFTRGALSGQLTGSQATLPPGNVSCNGGGGNWSSTATWSGAAVPTAGDNVTIPGGCTVTVDTAAIAFNVTVNNTGILQFETTTARTLTAGADVTINSGGIFQSATTGTQTGHVLSVTGNLTNNGTLNFSTNTNTAGADITFTGATNNTFGGTGGTTNIRTLTINKGTSNANILELNPTNFTVQGISSAVPVFLTLTNGTLKASGSFSFSSNMFTPAAYTIGATTGFWLNNPNFTVNGQNGSPTTSGLLRISQGTFNIGTSSGNSMGFASGSTIVVEGGAVNATGRFGVAAAGNAINYTQSGGTITVCTVGNGSGTLGSFDLGTSLSSTINISGGTIVVQVLATAIDYRDQAGAGFTAFTGGTLQLGNGSSPASVQAFNVRGVVPNLVITNTTANHTATFGTPVTYNNGAVGNITINTGNTLNIGNNIFLVESPTVTNNGTLTATGASSRYYHLGNGVAQTYTGTGVVTAPMTSFELDNALGLTLTPTNQVITARVILFTGSFTNANKITLGNGGATTGTVQIGNTTTPTNAGVFDLAPTFNLGTGGQIISYLRTTTARATGPEVNPTRVLTSMTYDDNDATHSLTIAGGSLTLSNTANALTLTNGRIITGSNTLALSSGTATVTRTNGYVDGNFKKNFGAAASKVFEVGTANGFSPVTVNATAGSFPADFTAKATQGSQPNVNASTSIQRYWTLTNTTVSSADLTFQYLAGDVSGTEANYKVIRVSGGTPVSFPASTVNTGTHTASLTGATSFSDWTVGEPTAPTAVPAKISGQVVTAEGRPLGGVTLNLAGNKVDRTITNENGTYRFNNVDTEAFYSVTPALTNYSFSPASRSFTLLADKTDAIFTATAASSPTDNPLNGGDFFVRQQYLDFLGREPDHDGWLFWTDQISRCGADDNCIRQKRIDVSAAFFMSPEFQQSGSYIYRLYSAALGRQLSYAEFTADHSRVVGGPDLEANKALFADSFVQRPEFLLMYQQNTTAETFVDALLRGVQGDVSLDLSGERNALIAAYNSRANLNDSRSAVLQSIANDGRYQAATYNRAFVLMQYFGYLKRGVDREGYNFWLNVMNSEQNNYRGMVCSFLTSAEYQKRFSQVVNHANSECGQ